MSSDLWILTSYFNPCNYKTRAENYHRFREGVLGQGAKLLTVELAFENQGHQLRRSGHDELLQVSGKHLMWQKERLLNIGVSQLPRDCSKVAWIDCDLVFEEAGWVSECSRRLDEASVIQPYSVVVRLLQGQTTYCHVGQQWRSFTSIYNDNSVTNREGWNAHGHTGFAWAGRRDWIEAVGLYDACIGGSADHMMAHAFANDPASGCVSRLLGMDTAQIAHFQQWARRLQAAWPQRIGAMEGRLLHLWHGEIENRGYLKRHKQLASLDFNPSADLRIGETGCWEWAHKVDVMTQWASTYFTDRKEDG